MPLLYHKKYLVSIVVFLLLFLIVNAQTDYSLDGENGLRERIDKSLEELNIKITTLQGALEAAETNESLSKALGKLVADSVSQYELLEKFYERISRDNVTEGEIDANLRKLFNNNVRMQRDIRAVYTIANDLTWWAIGETDDKLRMLMTELSAGFNDLATRNINIKRLIEGRLLTPITEEPPIVVSSAVPVSPPAVVIPPSASVSSDPFAFQAPATGFSVKDTDTFKGSQSPSWPFLYLSGWRTPTRGISDLVTRAKQDLNLYFGLRRTFVVRQTITHMEIEVCDEQNVCRTIIIAIPTLSENNQDSFVIRVRKALVEYFDSEKARKMNQGMNVVGHVRETEVPKINDQGWRPSTPVPTPFLFPGGPVDENMTP